LDVHVAGTQLGGGGQQLIDELRGVSRVDRVLAEQGLAEGIGTRRNEHVSGSHCLIPRGNLPARTRPAGQGPQGCWAAGRTMIPYCPRTNGLYRFSSPIVVSSPCPG
jgi:hypothetical protein